MEMPYPVAPDGKLHYCDPPFDGHSFVLANGSNVPVAVSDGYQSWLVAAGATQGAGLPSGVRSYQVQSVGVGQGPVTLYARDTLDPGVGLAQPISGSISAAITNALTAAVTGTVTATEPAEAQLDSRSFSSVGAKSYNVNIPAGTRGIILDIGSNTHGLFHGLTIVGATTGILYYADQTGPLSDGLPVYMPIVVPVFSSVDSAVTIAFTYDSTTGSQWIVYGLTGEIPPTLGGGAAQLVREYPLPTSFRGLGAAVAPAGNTLLTDSGALAAGDYAVEAELGADGVAALGKVVALTHQNAGGADLFYAVMPSPGSRSISWTRITVAAGDKIRTRTFATAFLAGESVWTQLRVYRIA